MITLRDSINQFIEWRSQNRKPRTINGFISNLLEFALWLRDGDKPIREITQRDAELWIKLHKEFGYSPNTVGKKVMALQSFFNFCIAKDWDIRVRPDLLLPPRKEFTFPRVANENDYRKLIGSIGENGKGWGNNFWNYRDKAMIMMLHDSFARNSEVRLLEMDDLDLKTMSARIKTEKSRGTIPFRQIFWRHETNIVLKRWIRKREKLLKMYPTTPDNYLFFSVKAGATRGRPIPESYVGEILRKRSNKAGLAIPINPHAFRHLGGQTLAKKGVNNSSISSLLGHSTIASSYIYTMLFGKEREKVYRHKVGK